MYIKTVKMGSVVKTVAVLILVAAIAFAAVYAINRLAEERPISLETEAERLEFLHSLGWETSEGPIDCRSVTIPKVWNDVYEDYNNLQMSQGFDLSKYRGKNAEIYSYTILNYEGRPDNMVANLVICDGKLIAADVCCTELGGFIQGIARIPDSVKESEGASKKNLSKE